MRRSLIDAGRRLLSRNEATSIRQIAQEAGCSPATIYQYFPDHRALLAALRQEDMDAATAVLEQVAAGQPDPRQRVRELFLGAAHYWLRHPDHFDCLFSRRTGGEMLRCADGTPFGQSETVRRSLRLYSGAVRAYLDSVGNTAVPTDLATHVLIATTHGVIAFARATRSMPWSDAGQMVECAIDALLGQWGAAVCTAAHPHPCKPA
jgi:AcrR family transcriptional regulator